MRKIVAALGAAAAAGVLALTPAVASASASTAPASGWTIQSSPGIVLPDGDTASIQLNAVYCFTARDCIAIGSYFDAYGNEMAPSDAGVLAERWNGSTWTIMSTPDPPGAFFPAFRSLSCTLLTGCTATGSYSSANLAETYPLVEHWNGRTWTIKSGSPPSPPVTQPLPTPPTGGPWVLSCAARLLGLIPPDRNDCTAVGLATDPATANSYTVAEHWDGSTWTSEAMPTVDDIAIQLGGISCPSAVMCMFVGDYYSGGPDFWSPLPEEWKR